MEVSEFNRLKDLSYDWYFVDSLKEILLDPSIDRDSNNLVAIVPELKMVEKLCHKGINFRGIINKDFVESLDGVIDNECVDKFSFTLREYTPGIENLSKYVDEDQWKRIHLFADEAVSNIVLHSGCSEGLLNAYFLENKSIILSITDKGGKFSKNNIRRALCSLCSSYSGLQGLSSDTLVIGGNGLKLLFHYVTFIKFNVIPNELTEVVGLFIPKKDFSGYIFEDRREEILNGCLFRKK